MERFSSTTRHRWKRTIIMRTLSVILVFSGLLLHSIGAKSHSETGVDSEWIASEHYYDGDVLDLMTQMDPKDNAFRMLKRTVDFGMSRGYSGTRLAKHLMGLQAAQYAAGPGRKRRTPSHMKTPTKERVPRAPSSSL